MCVDTYVKNYTYVRPNVDSRHACRNTSDLSHKKTTKKVSVITSPPRTNTQVFPTSKPSFWNFAHQPPQIKIAPKGNGWKRNGSTDYIVISPLVSIPKTNVRLSVETSRAPFLSPAAPEARDGRYCNAPPSVRSFVRPSVRHV